MLCNGIPLDRIEAGPVSQQASPSYRRSKANNGRLIGHAVFMSLCILSFASGYNFNERGAPQSGGWTDSIMMQNVAGSNLDWFCQARRQ